MFRYVVTMQQLIRGRRGLHFGHQTHRWNPRMKPYIFGERNGVHILDLSQTVPLFARALDFVSATVAAGGKVLFVGTKRQAQEPIAEGARVWPAFRQPPLAGRHAHQLEDHLWFDQAPEDAGRAALGRHARPHQEGSAPADARARQAGARSAASATWAAFRT
jgi:hypothetical protein